MGSKNIPIVPGETHCAVCKTCNAFVLGKLKILVFNGPNDLSKDGYGTRCLGMECENGHLIYVGSNNKDELKSGKVLFL